MSKKLLLGLGLTAVAVTGSIVYAVKESRKSAQRREEKMRKVEDILSQNDDFIPFDKMTDKVFKVKKVLDRYETAEENTSKTVPSNFRRVYYYNDKPVFSYLRLTHYDYETIPDGNGGYKTVSRTERTLDFEGMENLNSDYSDYYKACVYMFRKENTNGVDNWLDLFLSKNNVDAE